MSLREKQPAWKKCKRFQGGGAAQIRLLKESLRIRYTWMRVRCEVHACTRACTTAETITSRYRSCAGSKAKRPLVKMRVSTIPFPGFRKVGGEGYPTRNIERVTPVRFPSNPAPPCPSRAPHSIKAFNKGEALMHARESTLSRDDTLNTTPEAGS